jgi:hypothetical protein
MKQLGLVISWWAVCLLVVAIVWIDAFGASLNPMWAWMDANEKAASWVQAFGSIAAIFGSAAIAIVVFKKDADNRRHEAQEEKKAAQRAAVIEFQTGIIVLRVTLMTCQSNTANENWNKNNTRLLSDSLNTASQLLTGIDGRQLPEWFELQRALVVVGAVGASSSVATIRGDLPKQASKDFSAFQHTLDMIEAVDDAINVFLFGAEPEKQRRK